MSTPLPRDLATLRFIGSFGQSTGTQIARRVFSLPSPNSRVEAQIKRLKRAGLITVLPERADTGPNGGRAPDVYVLTREGWNIAQVDRPYNPRRRMSRHALGLATLFCELVERLRAEDFVLTRCDIETPLKGTDVVPDMTLILKRPGDTGSDYVAIEYDNHKPGRPSMGRADMLAKMHRYYAGWQAAGAAGKPYPRVIFAAIDATRQRQLEGYLRELPEQARSLFTIEHAKVVISTL